MENAAVRCAACPDRCGYADGVSAAMAAGGLLRFRTCSGETTRSLFYVRQSGLPPGCKNRWSTAFLESSKCLPTISFSIPRPQAPRDSTPPRRRNHMPMSFSGAVENLNRIICCCAVDRAAAILLQELKERLTPGMVEERARLSPR